MELYSLNAKVDFQNKPVIFKTPIIVDNELYQRCVDGYTGASEYIPNTNVNEIIAKINGDFLNKTDEWRNIVAPISPYVGIDSFNFFKQILLNIYEAPDGMAPAPDTTDLTYQPVFLTDGSSVPNASIEALPPPTYFSIRGTNDTVIESSGVLIIWAPPAFRRNVQYSVIILNENQILDGRFNFTDPIGFSNISLDKERRSDQTQVSVNFRARSVTNINFWNGKTAEPLTPPPPQPDPSGPGGGGGTLDDSSDPIDFPDPPSLTASSTGMLRLYSPTVLQLQSLSRYMWSDEFNLDTFKKLFADPMDVIIGLSIVPVTPALGSTETIKIGFVDTGVNCTTVENQYVTVDCGTLDIKEFFGTALDYSPYTKFSIYLPFIGTKELKTDDIMGKSISVRYTVDVLSGACTAHIKCGESVMYQYSGSCASTIPITSQNWSQLITSIIQLAGAGIATAMSGGAAAPMLPAAANTVLSAKPTIQRAGAVSGAAGFLGIQYPYLIWEHPRQSLPVGYNKFVGYPSNITQELGALTGFTQVESIHMENVPATQNELMEIESLLKEGVIF